MDDAIESFKVFIKQLMLRTLPLLRRVHDMTKRYRYRFVSFRSFRRFRRIVNILRITKRYETER